MELDPKDINNKIKQLEKELNDIQVDCIPHDITIKQIGGSLKRICTKCLMDCGYATEEDKKGYLTDS